MKDNFEEIPIVVIDTEKALNNLVQQLALCSEISIDTEFDDFNYQYGVHLQLIQIFDGVTCYLVDSIKIKNLKSLWAIFEDEKICKLLYAGSNDIGIFKKEGCSPKNIFDCQIAAVLCNRVQNSYADLILENFGVAKDKTQQRSRWDNRPLTAEQLRYAANDVIYLPTLKNMFTAELTANGLLPILEEENRLVEAATKTDYVPKLKPVQKKVFGKYAQSKLMELKLQVDEQAKLQNVPPYYIVRDSILEDIVKNKKRFLSNPFPTGFHKSVLKDNKFQKAFLAIVDSIDLAEGWENEYIRPEYTDTVRPTYEDRRPNEKILLPFKAYVINKYGEVASTVMLRGLSKCFTDGKINWAAARPYQKNLYQEFLDKA